MTKIIFLRTILNSARVPKGSCAYEYGPGLSPVTLLTGTSLSKEDWRKKREDKLFIILARVRNVRQ